MVKPYRAKPIASGDWLESRGSRAVRERWSTQGPLGRLPGSPCAPSAHTSSVHVTAWLSQTRRSEWERTGARPPAPPVRQDARWPTRPARLCASGGNPKPDPVTVTPVPPTALPVFGATDFTTGTTTAAGTATAARAATPDPAAATTTAAAAATSPPVRIRILTPRAGNRITARTPPSLAFSPPRTYDASQARPEHTPEDLSYQSRR